MMCTNILGSRQENMTLQMKLTKVFGRVGNVRPNRIIIDKCWLEYNVIKTKIEEDPSNLKI
jgi:hypothetical protein